MRELPDRHRVGLIPLEEWGQGESKGNPNRLGSAAACRPPFRFGAECPGMAACQRQGSRDRTRALAFGRPWGGPTRPKFAELLALFDAIRIGSARERKLATRELGRRLGVEDIPRLAGGESQ